MPDRGWKIAAVPHPEDDAAFAGRVVESYRSIYDENFSREPMVNAAMGFEIRSQRNLDGWRVMLLLTPWMLSRLLFPVRQPALSLPPGWSARERAGAAYQVVGPKLSLKILGQPQIAHLCFEPKLGHHLMQPVALSMTEYGSPEDVFEHWGRVIRTRDENMEKTRQDCPWQRAISRRELFGR